tara:strand:- start:400 stop:798 length:399 start_codon:yes stop_codon:yes gene_type:complete
MTEVKQLKLIGGEEVLCDLVAIELDEYESEVMVIRAAHSIISHINFETGIRYYTFKSFMMHINDPSHILLLNAGSVICMANPSDMVMKEYIRHVDYHRKEVREEENEEDPLDKLLKEFEDDQNIIKFNPKLH